MLSQLIGTYYSSRLEKMGFDLYKLITYLPFRLEVISPDIKSENGLIFLTGQVKTITNKGKFQVIEFKDSSLLYPVTIYDFGKKLSYLKSFNNNKQYQVLLTKSTSYYNLQEISEFSTPSDDFELGRLKRQNYYRPVYIQLNYTIRTKQLNKIFNLIPREAMILNLKGLIPDNNVIPQLLDMNLIHRPKNVEEFNNGIRNWNNFQAFLNMVFLNKLNQYERKTGAYLPSYPDNFIDEFQKNLNISLSTSQLTAIENILSNITVKEVVD